MRVLYTIFNRWIHNIEEKYQQQQQPFVVAAGMMMSQLSFSLTEYQCIGKTFVAIWKMWIFVGTLQFIWFNLVAGGAFVRLVHFNICFLLAHMHSLAYYFVDYLFVSSVICINTITDSVTHLHSTHKPNVCVCKLCMVCMAEAHIHQTTKMFAANTFQ